MLFLKELCNLYEFHQKSVFLLFRHKNGELLSNIYRNISLYQVFLR